MIRRTWKKLKGYFTNKKIDHEESIFMEEDEPLEEENDIQSSVTFIISKQGAIDLNISWEESDNITARNLAMLLYVINSGGFESNCASLLVNIASTQPNNASFIRECIEEWNNKKRQEPLIKPSEVFQFGTTE